MYFNNTFYKYYPKIRQKDIGTDTSNKFIDTLRFSNIYLVGCGGDYDGDQCSVKGVYTTEANDELREFMYAKQNFVSFGCNATRESGDDVFQAVFALTRVLSDAEARITKSKSIEFA